jgi:DNA repair exonuclease SbcCD nuclease subunit
VFVLGDIYDNRKAIDIGVSNIAIDIFDEIRQICPLYLMTGNHDLSKKTNNGNNSLRAFAFRDNVELISKPTDLLIYEGKSDSTNPLAKVIAIPYLGDSSEELKVLADHNKGWDYAFMHTEITNMQMDNGMSIISGVNPDAFEGQIIAGHIHKRQETKKVVYVGNPFQMSRGDVSNDKGLYLLDLKKKKMTFIQNDYSPKF